jgi:hypothetical protein
MQGSLDEHLGLAILFAGAAEQHSSDSNIADLCILWGRAIWHTEYVIEHAGESADNKRLANDNREAAKLWRAEFQAKMREQGVQQKCRKSAEMP